jgi:hypothetical protein
LLCYQKLAEQFEAYVNPDGLLSKAFYAVKENLPWFNASAHTLLISIMQAILQAYKVRLMCWQVIAFRARSKNNVSDYNHAQLEVILLLKRLPNSIIDLQNAVKEKIKGLKDARQNGLELHYDTCDSNFGDHRHHGDPTYRTTGKVHDPVSKRDLLGAKLQPVSALESVGDGLFFVSG